MSIRALKARLLPSDNADMGAALDELAAGGFRAWRQAVLRGAQFPQIPAAQKASHVHHLPDALRAYAGLGADIPPPVPDLFPAEEERRAQREEGEEEEGKEEKQTPSAGADGAGAEDRDFEEFWKAYAPPRNARKPDARRAWAATARLRPPLGDLLRAVAGYRAWLVQQSAVKRIYPMQHPATWLRGEVWNGFLESRAPTRAGRAAPGTAGGQAGGRDRCGAVRRLVSNAAFEAGPPARITVNGTFRQKWITDHFALQLARCYGECRIEVAS